jgi:hypothetical protein
MKLYFRQFVFILFQVLVTLSCWAQGSYRVTNFGKPEYSAGNQNWSIDVDKQGYIYVANNNGMMVFDGTHWKTYRTAGQSIVRSVHVSPDHRIYVGSFEEFGYWQKSAEGNFNYYTLKPLLGAFNLHNQEIWRIVQQGNLVYFQSFSALFVYDQHTVRKIETPGNVVLLLQARNRLFLQSVGGCIYELRNNNLVSIPGSSVLSGTEVNTMIPYRDHDFLVGTSSKGAFVFDGKTFSPWNVPANEQLIKYQINNGVANGKYLIFGTIVKGVFVLDQGGTILYHFDSENELQNNTVLSLCSDGRESVWAGLDMGISNISFNHPILICQEKKEQLGAVYTAGMVGNMLYIGTNRGVFRYRYENGKLDYLGMLDNSQGQVWQLKNIDGNLFCGHTHGTYLIDPQGLRKISDVNGGFSIQKLYQNGQEYLIQSTYTCLVIYKKSGNSWVYSHQVKGFVEPSRFLETDHQGNIWVGHTVKGLFRINLTEDLDSVEQITGFGQKSGLPSDYSIGVFKVASRIVFTTGSRLYTWDDLGNKIIPYDFLNKRLQGFEKATSIVDIGKGLYWFLTPKDIALFEIRENKVSMKYRLLLPLYTISMVDQYENVVALDSSRNLICLDNGFAIFDRGQLSSGFADHSKLIWSECCSFNAAGEMKRLDAARQSITLTHSFNTITLSFSVINSPGTTKLFQYKLQGIDPDWSDWSDRSEVKYTRLPKGVYKFSVRTITSSGQLTEPLTLLIKVQPAWFASRLAMLLYVLVSIVLLWLLLYMTRKRIERRHERLREKDLFNQMQEKQKSEQEIITLQNQNLQSEISYKNIQLADSTMAIIKKNEVLILIKNELARQKDELGTRYPTRYYEKINSLIDKNISNDNDWQIFESLFDQAHENFFKRLKQSYPDLTQSDLKLCAYLKLNLASKEIAPLLNISLRGVEIRRYRLRKRLGLATDENLVKTIMQF